MRSFLTKLLAGLRALTLVVIFALGTSAAIQFALTEVDRQNSPPPGELYPTSAGKLHLHCKGERGPALIIEAGGGAWSTFWTKIQDGASTVRRTCVYDRAGLGWSRSATQAQEAAEYARNLHELLAAAGERPPYVLAGHSLGGYLVRVYAEFYPDDVASVILIESAHEDQWTRLPPQLDALMRNLNSQMNIASWLANFGLMRILPSPDQGLSPEQEALIRQEMATARFWRANLKEFEQGRTTLPEFVRQLGRMDNMPLLVISAKNSVHLYCSDKQDSRLPPCEPTQLVWHALQQELASLSARGRQIVIPDATHAIYADAPGALIRAINAYLAEDGEWHAILPPRMPKE